MNKSYIKVPKVAKLPDSSYKKRLLSTDFWKKTVFSFLLEYYKNVDNQKILSIIETELCKKRSQIEKAIKNDISKWLNNNNKFKLKGLIINSEPYNDLEQEGYYDIKIQHSDWVVNGKNQYFVFEAKNIGGTNLKKSIDEYVFIRRKDIEDGGMYRFLSNKYSPDLNFGGMLGFVISNTNVSIINNLIEKISMIYNDLQIGKLTKEIIRNSIEGNSNTFDSVHKRQNQNNEYEDFTIHHIILDFYNRM